NVLLGVQVQFSQGKPRTDGSIIYLPSISGVLTRDEFEAYCGIALHEAAHVAIGSLKPFKKYAAKGQLEADCLNAVLDVADESRIERFINRAWSLFQSSNVQAFNQAKASGAFQNGNPRWIVLCLGILLNRVASGQ